MTWSSHKLLAILVFTFSSIPYGLWAQSSATDTLENIYFSDSAAINMDVKSVFLDKESGLLFDKKAKLVFNQVSLDQFLSTHSAIFIKEYGINSSSTLTLRGTAASQSQIIWEGIPINNAATGTGDLSLYATGIFDQIQVKYGSSSSLYGNGNIGGTLLLHATLSDQPSFQANLAMGSYKNAQASFKGNWVSKYGIFNLKLFGSTLANDFTYTATDDTKAHMTNAQKKEGGGMLSYYHTLPIFSKKKPLLINLNTWLQSTTRHIPPALFENASAKIQQDNSWRNVLNLTQPIGNAGSIYSKTAFSQERYDYRDSLSFIDQQYTLHNIYSEVGWSHSLPLSPHWKQHLLIFLPAQYNSLTNAHTHSSNHLSRYGIAAHYQLQHLQDWLTLQLGLRQEFQNQMDIPFIYNISAHTRLLQYSNKRHTLQLPLFISLQNSYRIPTLNELYYFPGGNKNLRPEYGINKELGARLLFRENKTDYFQLQLASTYFHRNVQDWIYWLGVSMWTPYNIASVYSRGWDHQLKLEKNKANTKWYATIDYAYTIATTTASYLPTQAIIGKQIPYTPRYVVRTNVGLTWHQLLINLSHNYTGYRFTNLDESGYLLPYQLYALQTRYTIPIASHQLISLQLMVNNLFNTNYQAVHQRPMPLRHFLFSISYNW